MTYKEFLDKYKEEINTRNFLKLRDKIGPEYDQAMTHPGSNPVLDYFQRLINDLYELNINILEGLKEIPHYFFTNCKNLRKIIIPSSIIEIGERAFIRCSSLMSVEIPGGVKNLGIGCFDGCTSLRKIKFNEGLENIGNGSFDSCYIKEAILPSTLKYLGPFSFAYCKNLEIIDLKKTSIEILEVEVFDRCEKLNKVFLPNTIKKIRPRVFRGCKNLTEIYFEGDKSYLSKVLATSSGFVNTKIAVIHCKDGDLTL